MSKKDNKISMPQTGAGLVRYFDEKISMPQTGAGLVRYFDEESVGPKLSPEHVLVATVIVAILCFVLRYSA